MTTRTLRLPDSLANAVDDVGVTEHVDASVAMRKLLRIGYITYVAERYRTGGISLRGAAKRLEMSMSEADDLLIRMGVTGNVTADDTLHSLRSLGER